MVVVFGNQHSQDVHPEYIALLCDKMEQVTASRAPWYIVEIEHLTDSSHKLEIKKNSFLFGSLKLTFKLLFIQKLKKIIFCIKRSLGKSTARMLNSERSR
jgi:hypothetical protein